MRATVILVGDTLWSVASRTLARSSYASYGAYADAIWALNQARQDGVWVGDPTALVPGVLLLLPA